MIIPAPADLAGRYRISNGSRFRLKDIDPNDAWGKRLKPIAGQMLKQSRKRMAGLQERLYAQDRWSILLIFQAMDAAGKDGTIKHVMSGVNPQGCDVHAFKAPSSEELDHDFLWRSNRRLPRRGHIGIFNRSYYEETLVVRVHQNILASSSCLRSLSPRTSGASGSRTSTPTSATLRARACSSASSSCTSRRTNSASASSRGSTSPRSTGSSRPADVGERSHFAAVHVGLRRHDSPHFDRMGAVACDSRGSQVVHAPRRVRRRSSTRFNRSDPRFQKVDPSGARRFKKVKDS
jgi:hypothetical protein